MSYCPVCLSTGEAPCRWPDGRIRKVPHGSRKGASPDRVKEQRAFSQAVKARDQGWCMAAGMGMCQSVRHRGQHAHHLQPRGRGGSDDPANGLWVCWEAHDWIHDHPEEAERLGLLRASTIP